MKKVPDKRWNYRGAAYLARKDLIKARGSFERVLKLDPTFFPAAAAAKARFDSVLKPDPQAPASQARTGGKNPAQAITGDNTLKSGSRHSHIAVRLEYSK